ncbi:hypothetical protein NKR23_g9776 [Pleurostoma richardsiae]|uniref:BTB domain-containing protein n=1 Tax=Pleurostoma richardsiae TaxID=41990 RepID=A0AA38VEN6_9PEZI|nr:hypothetical protein NKR23_g9776 [Pleurostoma richardsiae]
MASPTKPAPSVAAASSGPVLIDEDGDLILVVGPEKKEFRVCSRTMRRSANFWKTLLYGSSAEAKRPKLSDWRVELPEDSAAAMEVLLYSAHNIHKQITPGDNLDLIYRILFLADKYDMDSCLTFRVERWLPRVSFTTQYQFSKKLWVLFRLGKADDFWRSIVKKAYFSSSEEMYIANDPIICTLKVYETIAAVRKHALNDLRRRLDAVWKHVFDLATASSESRTKQLGSMILGALIVGSSSVDNCVWPVFDQSRSLDSIDPRKFYWRLSKSFRQALIHITNLDANFWDTCPPKVLKTKEKLSLIPTEEKIEDILFEWVKSQETSEYLARDLARNAEKWMLQ